MKFYIDIYLDHNLGDDLFLDTLLQRYPEHDFYVGIPLHIKHLNAHFEKYSNLKVTKPIGIKNIFSMLEYDAYLLIGGSIYMDLNESYHRLWLSRLIKSFVSLITGKPFFVLGANLGPLNTRLGKFLLFIHFNLVKHITVRDCNSYNLLKKWKKFNSFSLAPDIVFSHKNDFDISRGNAILGVSVINNQRDKNCQEDYIQKIISLINEYFERSAEHKVTILGFDGGLENDDVVIKEVLRDHKIKEKLSSGSLDVLNYTPSIKLMDYLETLSKCDYFICSRFHAMILAMKYDKVFFPICYSNKMESVLLDAQCNELGIKYKNIAALDVRQVIDRLLNDENSTSFNKEYMKKSNDHFSCIDNLISSQS